MIHTGVELKVTRRGSGRVVSSEVTVEYGGKRVVGCCGGCGEAGGYDGVTGDEVELGLGEVGGKGRTGTG